VKLILERRNLAGSGPLQWYCQGKAGSSSCRVEVLQVPARFMSLLGQVGRLALADAAGACVVTRRL
jgi:hypothetical protein